MTKDENLVRELDKLFFNKAGDDWSVAIAGNSYVIIKNKVVVAAITSGGFYQHKKIETLEAEELLIIAKLINSLKRKENDPKRIPALM